MDSPQSIDPLERILPTVHEGVRKSKLVIALHERIGSLPVGAFPFFAELHKLRDVIAPQIGDTRLLFPEFTPHDEALHVAKLFQLADKLFGDRTYTEMNAAELFLAGCALYAHDWGMAVGREEKEYLRQGAREPRLTSTYTPLPDECERLSAFVRVNGLLPEHGRQFPLLSDQHLRLYVRETHARRSGARVRQHFLEHPAVGEALARLCEGHWHDFATLDNPNRFPREYEAAGETVNLLALTLQIRLTDLFHITDDRTPFALWRFVSPVDVRSAQEWKKHRALHGITVVDFPPGRAIKVQGFTEDEEVWAGLRDLRRYCEDQIRGSLEVSARHVPHKYGLNFVKVDWAVPTGNLRPIDLRFEFDRIAMFRVLSNDIYEGDQYIFLRELLQNAIDAVRTRRARHLERAKLVSRRKLSSPSFDTAIYFTAEHAQNGDIVVRCRDYGVGMDEHLIRNYFSVAGVSYYRSAEFERQHLGFEPIARFGIGILSCFMVAETLQVRTYRDPECGPAIARADSELPGSAEHRARRLQFEIPGVHRQFVVKDLNGDFAVGTEVCVKVLAAKLRDVQVRRWADNGTMLDDDVVVGETFKRKLQITEYLCAIAGFVEFPILVDEHWPGGERQATLILHPDRDPELERQEFEGNVDIQQLSRSYPWDNVIDEHSMGAAMQCMTQTDFELKELLGDKGYEGWVVYPTPKDQSWDFSDRESRLYYSIGCDTYWRNPSTGESPAPPLHWMMDDDEEDVMSGSRLQSVYRDGILLEKVVMSRRVHAGRTFPPPLICVNLPSEGVLIPNVARTGFSTKQTKWDAPIWKALEDAIQKDVTMATRLPLYDRLFRMGWIASVFGLDTDALGRMIPHERLISAWLSADNKVELREGCIEAGQEVPLVPSQVTDRIKIVSGGGAFGEKLLVESTLMWKGPSSLVLDLELYFSVPLQVGWSWAFVELRKRLDLARIQFLAPGKDLGDLLIQSVGVIGEVGRHSYEKDDQMERQERLKMLKRPEIICSLATALSSPNELKPHERACIGALLRNGEYDRLLPIMFATPFKDRWASCENHINAKHPVGQVVMRCVAACLKAEERADVGRKVRSWIERLSNQLDVSIWDNSIEEGSRLSKVIVELFELVLVYSLIDGFSAPEMPSEDERIPSMPGISLSQRRRQGVSLIDGVEEISGPCGELIVEWPVQ